MKKSIIFILSCVLVLVASQTHAIWYDNHYAFKQQITIQSGQVDGSQTDFPVLITQADLDTSFFNHVRKSDPADIDIIFTNAAQDAELAREVVRFDSSGQEFEAWIKTDLGDFSNTVIYMYYGYALASQPNAVSTWSNDFAGVWHMEETPTGSSDDIAESTIYDNDGTSQNMEAADQVAGQIGGALNFNGSDEYLNCGDASNLRIVTAVTISAWINLDNASSSNYMRILSKKPTWDGTQGYGLELNPNNSYLTVLGSGADYARTSNASYTTNWHYVVGVVNGTTGTLYFDGSNAVAADIVVDALVPGTQSLAIARIGGGADYFDGQIDEVRVTDGVRSANWISTSYNNQSNPGSFYNVGSEVAHPDRFRSVAPGVTAALDSGGSNALTIVGFNATFASSVANNVGVGDILIYDANNDGGADSRAVLHERASGAGFTVKNTDGTLPTETSTAVQNWDIYRAYTSLSEAESGDENIGIPLTYRDFDTGDRDISSNEECWHFICYNGSTADTTAVTWDGWTTDATHYVRIASATSVETGDTQRHDGKWDSSAYRIEVSNTTAVNILDEHVRVEGLQIWVASVNANSQKALNFTGSTGTIDARISSCVFRGDSTAGNEWHHAVSINNLGDGVAYVWNNVFYDFNGDDRAAGIEFNDADVTLYAYNNTIHNCYNGYWQRNGTMVAKNNIAQDCFDGFGGTFGGASDYNCSDLGSDAPGLNSQNSTTVTFFNEGNDDFHLATGDLGALANGTNLAADANLAFVEDIDGDSRADTWDIGADEYSGIPPTPTQTPSITVTSTVTFTATESPVPSETATPTISATFSHTPTITPSPTITVTSTHSPIHTPTVTGTITQTATISATYTITPTMTYTYTRTVTPTVTLSGTFTPSGTITQTYTITPTMTITPVYIIPENLQRVITFPNPYRADVNARSYITFRNVPQRTIIRLYDLSGQLVTTLYKEDTLPDLHWDLKNQTGKEVASGVYLYVMKALAGERKGKIVILK